MKKTAGQVQDILDLIRRLRGEEGCPWDRKQTIESLPKYVHSEFQELAEVFNDLSTTLNQHFNDINTISNSMKVTLKENPNIGDQERSLLIENIGKLEVVLGHYKLTRN